MAADDLDAEAGRPGLAAESWSRRRATEDVLRWRLAGVDAARADPARPFLIAWDVPPAARPQAASPQGTLRRLDVAGELEALGPLVPRGGPSVHLVEPVGGRRGPVAVVLEVAGTERGLTAEGAIDLSDRQDATDR